LLRPDTDTGVPRLYFRLVDDAVVNRLAAPRGVNAGVLSHSAGDNRRPVIAQPTQQRHVVRTLWLSIAFGHPFRAFDGVALKVSNCQTVVGEPEIVLLHDGRMRIFLNDASVPTDVTDIRGVGE